MDGRSHPTYGLALCCGPAIIGIDSRRYAYTMGWACSSWKGRPCLLYMLGMVLAWLLSQPLPPAPYTLVYKPQITLRYLWLCMRVHYIRPLLYTPLERHPLWHTVYRVGTTVHLAPYTVRRKDLCGPPLTNGTYGQTGGRSHPTDGRFSGASALLNGGPYNGG